MAITKRIYDTFCTLTCGFKLIRLRFEFIKRIVVKRSDVTSESGQVRINFGDESRI